MLLCACSGYIDTYYNVYYVGENHLGCVVKVKDKEHQVYKSHIKRLRVDDAPYVEGYDYIANMFKLYKDNKNNMLYFYSE